MPTRTANFFMSAVTKEFGSYRGEVNRWLGRPGVRIETQEKFVAFGDATLLMLDDYIAKCDAVIHLVGDRTGEIASEANRAKLLSQTHRSDLPEKLGLDPAAMSSLSYTQWEAWLAEYHGKKLYIARSDAEAPRDGALDDPAQAERERQSQSRHLNALQGKAARYPAFTFANSDKLCLNLLRDLHALLPPVSVPISDELPKALDLFIGRDKLLEQIREAFQPKRAGQVALWGMWGVGKTRLAAEYARRYADKHTALLLVSAATPEVLKDSFAKLADALRPEEPSTDKELRRKAAIEWLNDDAHRGWFLLIDNVDDETAFEEAMKLLKELDFGCVILAGRLRRWPPSVKALELDRLEPEDAAQYLLDFTAGKRRPDPAGPERDRDLAELIANELDGLPLALTYAAALIKDRPLSFAEYLAEWKTKGAELFAKTDLDPNLSDYTRTMAMTWKTSYNQLTPAHAAVFDALCWLAPNPIPERLITKPWKPEALALLPEDLHPEIEGSSDSLLLPLYNFCLAEPTEGLQRLFSIQRLAQDVCRLWQRESGTAAARAELALRLVEADFVRPATIENLTLHILPELRATAPHVLAVLEMPGFPARPPLVRSRLRRVLATIRWTEGRLAEAVLEAWKAVDEARAARAADDSDLAQATLAEALNELATDLESQGDFRAGVDAGNEAVTLREALVKKEPENLAYQRELATALSYAGRNYELQGEYDRALDLFVRSRLILEALGEKDRKNLAYQRDLGIALNYLGLICKEWPEYDQAQNLFTRFQEISEALVKKEPENLEHQRDLGIALENVRQIWEQQGKYGLARDLFTRFQEISETLVKDEPENLEHQRDLAIALENVGQIWEQQGKYDLAQDLFARSLRIREALVKNEPENSDHQRNLGNALENVGRICVSREDFRRAQDLFVRSQRIRELLVNKEPENLAYQRDLGVTLSNFGQCCEQQGDISRAQELLALSLRILEALVEKQPENLAYQRELYIALWKAGLAARKAGKRGEAVNRLESAKAFAQELLDQGWSGAETKEAVRNIKEEIHSTNEYFDSWRARILSFLKNLWSRKL